MKPIAHRDGGRGAHPLGIVEHVVAIVVIRHECVLDCVEQTTLSAAVGEAVVTWILREYRRVCEVTEKSERRLAGQVDSKSFPVAFGALPEGGIPVVRLIDPGKETRTEKRQGVKRIVGEQNEFVLGLKRAEERAWLIVRLRRRLAFQCAAERTHELLERLLILVQAHEWRRFQARRRGVLPGLLLNTRRGFRRLLCLP